MEHKIWNPRWECATREEKNEIQLERLKKIAAYCYERVPFYKQKFDEIGLRPEHIKTLSDVKHLPFTTADDLKNNYPFGLFAVPKKEIVRIHGSSGTTGKPKIVGYTKNDLENWTECLARLITAAGVTSDDTTQIAFGYGLFTGGFGLHYGMERVGAMVVPLSSGNTDRQIMLMQDFESTVLVATPSYALHLAEAMARKGIDKSKLKLRLALFGGEGHTEEMRAKIENALGILATENYGLSEVGGPGVSGECYLKCGLHFAEDHFLPEIVDQNTLKPLRDGMTGELVISTLTKEGLPLIRYRTKDLTSLDHSTCQCGRTTARIARFTGRTDDMLIIRGVNVFPSQIESALLEMGGTTPHYLLIVDRVNNLDTLEVQVEVEERFFSDEIRELENLTGKIAYMIQQAIGLAVKVKLVEPKSIERSMGKTKHVIDKRNLN